MDANQWIERHFIAHPACIICSENPDKPSECMCGRPTHAHERQTTREWTVSRNCTRQTTSSYGKLVFADPPASKLQQADDDSSYAAPYVRLSSRTRASEIVQLLTEHWGLSAPRMLLSVTGGARSFDLPPLLDQMLSTGLERAASCGSVWIITGGMNSGVMRSVGQWSRGNKSGESCPIIGISPYAPLPDSDKLLLQSRGEKVYYGDPNRVNGRHDPDSLMASCRLDRNHTHFVLIDDGRVGKFGGEIESRSAIEGEILRCISTGQFGTPSHVAGLTIAIQGGIGTLQTCIKGMQQGLPLLVVEGSGLAADLIAYVSHLYHHRPGYTERGLEQLIVDLFGNGYNTKPFRDVLALANQCGELSDMIYTYGVDYFGNNAKPFDRAILDTLLDHDAQRSLARQAWMAAPMSPKERAEAAYLERVRKLEFALLWDRIDLARKELSLCRMLTPRELQCQPLGQDVEAKIEMLKYALIKDSRPFVELFVDVMDATVLREVLMLRSNKLAKLHDESMMCGEMEAVTAVNSLNDSPATSQPQSRAGTPPAIRAAISGIAVDATPDLLAGSARASVELSSSPPPPAVTAATAHANPALTFPDGAQRPGSVSPVIPTAATRAPGAADPLLPPVTASEDLAPLKPLTAFSALSALGMRHQRQRRLPPTPGARNPSPSSTSPLPPLPTSMPPMSLPGATQTITTAEADPDVTTHPPSNPIFEKARARHEVPTQDAASSLAIKAATSTASAIGLFPSVHTALMSIDAASPRALTLPAQFSPLVRARVPLPVDIDTVYSPIHLDDYWGQLAKEFFQVFGPLLPGDDQHHASDSHLEAVRYIVGLMADFGYAVSHYSAKKKLEPAQIPDLNRLLLFLSINHYHAVQHELLRAGRAAQAWADLSDKAREIKTDMMLQFFSAILKADFRIWKPTLLEELYVRVAASEPRASHVLHLFKGGMMRRLQIAHTVKSLICADFRFSSPDDETAMGQSPYFDLLLWAAVSNRQALIDYFWSRDSQNAVVNAVVVAKISRSILDNPSRFLKPEIQGELFETATNFSEKALKLLFFCEDIDSTVTTQLMRQRTVNSGALPFWRMCYRCGEPALLASAPAQRVVKEQWFGKLKSTSVLKIILGILFVPYLALFAPRSLKEKYKSNFFLHKLRQLGWMLALHLEADEYAPESTAVVAKVLNAPGVIVKEHSTRQSYGRTIVNRFIQFFCSPTVYYWTEVLSWLTFVVLFSFVAVSPLQDATNYREDWGMTVSNVRTVVYVWLAVLIADEWMQLYHQGRAIYFSSFWNSWDLIIDVIVIISIILIHSDSLANQETGRTLWALVAMSHWLRIGRLYASNPVLGPKIVMIRLMFSDIMVFIAFLLIVLIGYGVALYSFIYPFRALDSDTMSNILYWPYFQVFGDSHLEEIRELSGCLGDQFTSCRGQGVLSVALLAVYILIANVLLVNLLIAMMSNTFQRVNDSSRETWALQNVELLEEIRSRVKLLGPLNILSHIYHLYRIVVLRNHKVGPDQEPPPEPDERVGKLVVKALARYHEEASSEKNQLAQLSEKLAKMQETVEQLKLANHLPVSHT